MSRLEKMVGAQSDTAVIFFNAIKAVEKDKKEILVFVEGYDDPFFYSHMLYENFNPSSIEFIICKGKRKVYNTAENIDKHQSLRRSKCLFFVDKDLSDLIGEKYDINIPCTQYYSIESYLIDESCFAMIWNELFQFKSERPLFSEVLEIYQNQLRIFNGYMHNIMSYILYYRRNGIRIVLNDIFLSDFYYFENLNIKEKTRGAFLRKIEENNRERIKNVSIPNEEELNKLTSQLLEIDNRSYIRGKYHMWFIRNFIKSLQKYYENHNVFKLTSKEDYNEKYIMRFLGDKIKKPLYMKEYIVCRCQLDDGMNNNY